jgi:hypothetical protein
MIMTEAGRHIGSVFGKSNKRYVNLLIMTKEELEDTKDNPIAG